MLYLYAVRAARGAPARGLGLLDRPLREVSDAGLAAVVSEVDRRPPADEDSLWRHEHVVESLMSADAVLPMRFGSVLEHDEDVSALLRTRSSEFMAALERVAGAIELGVRAAWAADSAEPAAETGAAYMHGLVHRRRQASHLADLVDAPLSALSRASRRRLLVTPNLPLSGAYLVEREHLEAFRRRVSELDQEIGPADIVCTGPWPPYSFVGTADGVGP